MKLLALALVMLLSGCGYKPSAFYAKQVLGETVYVDVVALPSDPENAIIIKDSLMQALMSRFRVAVRDRSHAQSFLSVSIGVLQFTPIEYNENGFVISQRCTTSFIITRTRGGKSATYNVMGTFDFNIDPNGIVSETQRFEAIRFSSLKAVDALVTQLAVEGSRI